MRVSAPEKAVTAYTVPSPTRLNNNLEKHHRDHAAHAHDDTASLIPQPMHV